MPIQSIRSRVGNRKVFTAGFVALLLAAAPFARAGDGSPVLATERSESNPAVSIGYIAWSQNSAARPRHEDLYAQPDGAAKFKVNAPRTEGFGGNIDGSTLVYTQWRNGRGDIKFFNLEDRTRVESRVPEAGYDIRAQLR
ncbi:MAG: hypothetical protein H0U53_00585 [Actinobacteria bacterium]|nr:hypothetical protein [Actinomycetota bacterium]